MANKKNLAERVQEKLDISGNAANDAVSAVLEAVMELTKEDGHLGIANFGVFESRERAERKGRNMQTGEPIIIPVSKVPVFHAAKEFKDRIKG